MNSNNSYTVDRICFLVSTLAIAKTAKKAKEDIKKEVRCEEGSVGEQKPKRVWEKELKKFDISFDLATKDCLCPSHICRSDIA